MGNSDVSPQRHTWYSTDAVKPSCLWVGDLDLLCSTSLPFWNREGVSFCASMGQVAVDVPLVSVAILRRVAADHKLFFKIAGSDVEVVDEN